MGIKFGPKFGKKTIKFGPKFGKKGPKKAKKGPKKQKKGKKGKKGKKQLKKGPKKAVKFGAPLGTVGLGGSGAALGVGFAANGGIPVPGVFTGPEADIRFRLNNG